MAKLSKKLKRRIVVAVTSEEYGKELIDAIEQGGSEVLSGDGSPLNSLGENGNLYIDLISGDLYKKYDDSWYIQPVGEQGPQGIQGEQGPQGIQGIQGYKR
jgi:hypothetical protein